MTQAGPAAKVGAGRRLPLKEAVDLPEQKKDSARAARPGVVAAPLSWKAARTLYNLADALWPPDGPGPEAGALDVARPLARELRHQGPAAARRLWLWCAWLDWAPLLRPRGRRFWRLSREERVAAFARFESSRLVLRRRAAAELREQLARAVQALYSSDGA